VIAGGPFGFNQAPLTSIPVCTDSTYYQFYIPTCNPATAPLLVAPEDRFRLLGAPLRRRRLPAKQWTSSTTSQAPRPSKTRELFSFAVYNRKNKLPYTINSTFDIQWQPRNDLSIQIGYVGNLGRHLVIPLPSTRRKSPAPLIRSMALARSSRFILRYQILDPNTLVQSRCRTIRPTTLRPEII